MTATTSDAICVCSHPIAWWDLAGWLHVDHERWACDCNSPEPKRAA